MDKMNKAIYDLAVALNASKDNYTKENFNSLKNLLKDFYTLSNKKEVEVIEVDFIPDIIEKEPKVTKAKNESKTNDSILTNDKSNYTLVYDNKLRIIDKKTNKKIDFEIGENLSKLIK
ncbi:hypothetical protein U729_3264 (plasmid) [Clostridium baratii str. Sullivan]|uniref:Uncharacterized protein n=1 Tax=Clostridium baratii str. Sullivan TaxID=1415775 RepID=A0A0A7G0P9_9CLOT|nr:hypothetical protein [Clostridium baratii]AIY85412.1 hypothetical protein U729_3264 [Clostridium baratii str. Sullivan]